jgi:hypothetical protein
MIHGYSGDVHHLSFILMSLFLILLQKISLQVVAGIWYLTGEDGSFHHHPHVFASQPLDRVSML